MNDRMKLIIYGGVTAAVFVISALVPLLFRGGEVRPRSEGLSAGERAELFGEYWNGGGEGCTVSLIDEPESGAAELCSARMKQISTLCLADEDSGQVSAEGSEYFSVSRGADEIRLCRMWREIQSDWRTWLDICFDMDNGDVYYLYFSAECVSNADKYSELIPEGMDAGSIAEHFARQRGYELMHVNWEADDSGTGDAVTAIYTAEGSAVCMSIKCVCYKTALIDVKICCV